MGAIIKRAGIEHLSLVERGKRTITSASLGQGMLTDDTVKFSVISNSHLDIKINDTIEVFGSIYRINVLPSFKKNGNSSYSYEIEAQGLMYDLLRCKFFNADGEGFKTTTNFPLIGNLEVFLIAIRNNMRRYSIDWEIGSFVNAETKMITFGDDTCLSALQKICQEFKTDFWVKAKDGKFKIFTGEFGTTLPIDFEYGKGKGLYSLDRSNVNDNDIVNRLYVSGGTENIPAEYRNFSDNLKFSDDGYLEDLPLIAEIGLREGSIDFPEIYPKRTGVVSSIGDTKFKFIDSSMDFDLNEKNPDGSTKFLIAGTSAKIKFTKGNLAGYEFEIKKNGYTTATKQFEIIPFKNASGQQFPDETKEAFQINVGDEYVLLDIVMPPTYIANAESELLAKGTEQFVLNKTAKVSYELNVDPEYLKSLATPISVGDYVRVKDSAMGIDKVIRVQAITWNFITNNTPTPYNCKITLADTYEINYASQMVLDITDIKNVISITNLGNINLSQLGYKTTQELRNLIFDTDGFFDPENIKPFSITTNMLTVGAQSQQLSCSVVFMVNNAGNANQIEVKSGALYSQTLVKTWTISGGIVTIPDNNFRYVYAKCSKIGTAGTIHFSQSQIKFDEDPNDFYFLLGILHTVTEGVRILSITIGTTTINGGLIRTGIISTLDGQRYFNIDTGEIRGKITFTSDSPAFEQINASIIIGGRNLLRNSEAAIENNLYPIATYLITETIASEQTVTLSFKGLLGVGKTMLVYNSGGTVPITSISSTDLQNGVYKKTFPWVVGGTNNSLYLFPNPTGGVTSKIEKVKLEKGTKATDWTPAPEDVSAQILEVQNYATTINNLVSDIANDNKITPSEKQQLKQEYDIIVAEKPEITTQAQSYGVTTALTAYNNAYTNLVTFVSPLLVNLTTTSDVDGVTLRSRFTVYFTAKVNLLKAITDVIDNDLTNIHEEMQVLEDYVNQEISDINDQVNELDIYVNGAFSDGIITKAEAIAIEKYLNQINTEKADVQNKYNQIYNDSYLTGTPKTNLSTAWNNYSTSHTNLINSINTAIADGKTTLVEKADVDAKFLLYRNNLAILSTRFQEAIKAIETASINAIQIGGRNLLYNSEIKTHLSKWFVVGAGIFQIIGEEIYIEAGGQFNGIAQSNAVLLENSSEYTVSFKIRFTNNAGGNTVLIGAENIANSFVDTSIFPADINGWQTVYYSKKATTNGLSNFLIFGNGGVQNFYIKDLKIEKGNKATGWTPAPEDIAVQLENANTNSANALAQALNAINTANAAAAVTNFLQTTIDGNVVSTGTLQVGDVNGANAFISGVTDQPNGESIRFAAGKPYDEKYNSPFQVLDNGLMRFVNPLNGRKTFELGFNQATGKVIFDIYDDSGVKIATIGSQGIVFTGYIAESYTSTIFRKLTTTTFTASAIQTEIQNQIQKTYVSSSPNFPPYTQQTWDISVIENYTAYLYNEGRNFESAGNAQYAGYYTTANKFGTKIPNGIYVLDIVQRVLIGNFGGAPFPSTFIYYGEAYRMLNGIVVETLAIQITKTINSSGDWGGGV